MQPALSRVIWRVDTVHTVSLNGPNHARARARREASGATARPCAREALVGGPHDDVARPRGRTRMRPPVAHAGRTSRPTRVALVRRLTGPTGGRTIGVYRCGGAAPRMAAFYAGRGAAFRGARCAAAGAARRAGAGGARCAAADVAGRAACHEARHAADRPPATHRPNGRVAAPEPDLGWTSGGVATRSAGRRALEFAALGEVATRGPRGRDAPDNRIHGGDRRGLGVARRPPHTAASPPTARRGGARPTGAAWPARPPRCGPPRRRRRRRVAAR